MVYTIKITGVTIKNCLRDFKFEDIEATQHSPRIIIDSNILLFLNYGLVTKGVNLSTKLHGIATFQVGDIDFTNNHLEAKRDCMLS